MVGTHKDTTVIMFAPVTEYNFKLKKHSQYIIRYKLRFLSTIFCKIPACVFYIVPILLEEFNSTQDSYVNKSPLKLVHALFLHPTNDTFQKVDL